jgi:hypothetical protein
MVNDSIDFCIPGSLVEMLLRGDHDGAVGSAVDDGIYLEPVVLRLNRGGAPSIIYIRHRTFELITDN